VTTWRWITWRDTKVTHGRGY